MKAVFFDMDGVLTDSEPVICASAIQMLREHGVEAKEEDFIPFVGTGENSYIGGVARKYGLDLDIIKAKARTYEIYLEMVPGKLKAFPGAVELVKECQEAGLKTAVASSADLIKVEANLREIGIEWIPRLQHCRTAASFWELYQVLKHELGRMRVEV